MFEGKGLLKINKGQCPIGIEIAQNGVRTYLRRYIDKIKDKEEMKTNAMKLVNSAIINHYLFNDDGRINIYEPFSLVVRMDKKVILIDNDKQFKNKLTRVSR